ncbi:hypothetical protein IAT38_007877 [Cryptococcus sp. DSM 104549]
MTIAQGLSPAPEDGDALVVTDGPDESRSLWHRVVVKHLNFFRLHILVFTFTPIVASCIMYAANGSAPGNANSTGTGRQKVHYIDCLFLCFSAMTTTGLCTVNLSALHPFQQVLLFFLFIVGDYTFVSLIMVLVRKRYFRTHCEQLLLNDRLRRYPTMKEDFSIADGAGASGGGGGWPLSPKQFKSTIKKLKGKQMLISGPVEGHSIEGFTENQAGETGGEGDGPRVTDSPADMTFDEREQREDTREREADTPERSAPSTMGRSSRPLLGTGATTSRAESPQAITTARDYAALGQKDARQADPAFRARQRLRTRTRANSINLGIMQHPPPPRHHHGNPVPHVASDGNGAPSPAPRQSTIRIETRHHHHLPPPLPLHQTTYPYPYPTSPTAIPVPIGHKNTGMGGFPTPFELLHRFIPARTKSRLARPVRRMGVAIHPAYVHDPEDALHAHHGHEESWGEMLRGSVARWMPEGLQGMVIGRNSRFWTEELEDEELEQIGGVEYRALRLLSYLVPGYMLVYQMIPFAIMAIYFSKVGSWNTAFQSDAGTQADNVNKTWSMLFLSSSAYTGCGMTLTDQGLAPFQEAYLLIYVIIIVMLVGNHALPIMLRFVIWLGTKIYRRGVKHETLHFLLDHPRRCFLYLFPSHQTWYLLFILIAFTLVELVSFLVLNIGLPVYDSLKGWDRFSDGLLQSLSVRAAGFGILSVSSFAPSVLFLYVILMYVAIYPIAMSVRSTNVYEERALGVYEHDDPETASEDEPQFKGRRHEVFSKYLMWHMRRQLAFDVWPLAVAIFLISVFERGKILDPEKSTWFSIFRILFECTSAYSTIGLTLGTPNNNYAFSGEMGTASKLVMIAVMLRGRHRGLPVAIDRAILLPKEYARIVKPNQSSSGGEALEKTSSRVNPFAQVVSEDDRARPIEMELEGGFGERDLPEKRARGAYGQEGQGAGGVGGDGEAGELSEKAATPTAVV